MCGQESTREASARKVSNLSAFGRRALKPSELQRAPAVRRERARRLSHTRTDPSRRAVQFFGRPRGSDRLAEQSRRHRRRKRSNLSILPTQDKVVVVDKSSPLCREPLRCASPLFASTCARVGLSSHLSRVRKCAGAAMMGAAALTRTRALSDRLWRGDRLQHRNTCAEVSAACLPRARAPLLCRSPRSRPACRARRALRHPVTCASTACSPGVHSAAADSLPANHGTGDGARAADGLDRLRHPLTLRL